MAEHVGSTAIPDLGGKGIIDIAIAVNKKEMDLVLKKLQKLGYAFSPTGSTLDRLFFSMDLPDKEEGIRRYHIHLTYPESKDWKGMIGFRDYLKNHPEEAQKYAEVKKRAANVVNEDGAKYRKMKEPTFKKILTKILGKQRLP